MQQDNKNITKACVISSFPCFYRFSLMGPFSPFQAVREGREEPALRDDSRTRERL